MINGVWTSTDVSEIINAMETREVLAIHASSGLPEDTATSLRKAGFTIEVTPISVMVRKPTPVAESWVPEWAEYFSMWRKGLGIFEIQFHGRGAPLSGSSHPIADLAKMLAIEDVKQQIAEKPLTATEIEQRVVDHKEQLRHRKLVEQRSEPADKVFMGLAPKVIGVVKCECGTKAHIKADVFDVLGAFTGHYEVRVKPIVDHLLKKLLAGGDRGRKDLRQDMVDVRDSAQRAIDTIDEWS